MSSQETPKMAVLERYEIKPGLEVLEYLRSWLSLNRFAKKVTASEYKFFLDVSSGVDRAILTSGAFEKAILDIIKAVCVGTNYTDQMVDIGANIGNHSVCLAGVFKDIASVEPNPVIFKVLEANILRNNIKNAQCYNFGLAEKASSATLVATSANHSLGKVKQHTTLGADAFNIDDSAFDIEHSIQLESTSVFFERFAGLGKKTFIKIDVEGMEQEILTQLLPFIRAEEPIVGFEWYVREQQGIKDIIASLPNYAAYVIDSNDQSDSNPLMKAVHLLQYGRKFSMKPYAPADLKAEYPLVMLIPSKLDLSSIQP
jgi:FkbM family methyltransferase